MSSPEDFTLEVLKSTLRCKYASEDQGVREVFDIVDDDASGHLDLDEMQIAAAMLGGILKGPAELQATLDKYANGDGLIDFEAFTEWWADEERNGNSPVEEPTEPAEGLPGRGTTLTVHAGHWGRLDGPEHGQPHSLLPRRHLHHV